MNPQVSRPSRPTGDSVRVGGPWSRPSTTAVPARSGRARRRPGSRPTTSRRRSRCSGRCCCRATPPSAAIEICGAADFYKPAHGHIFGAVIALFERGEAVDAVTVTDELRRSGLLDVGRATRPCSSRCRPTRRRSPTPCTTPASSRSTPCSAGWSAWPARSPRSATASPRTWRAPSTRPRRWSSTSPSAGRPSRSSRCATCSTPSLDRIEELAQRQRHGHRGRAPATPTSTRSWPACSPPA